MNVSQLRAHQGRDSRERPALTERKGANMAKPKILTDADPTPRTRTKKSPDQLTDIERVARAGAHNDASRELLDGLDGEKFSGAVGHMIAELDALRVQRDAYESARSEATAACALALQCDPELIPQTLKLLLGC
jgi:hypothetical protein